MHVDVAAARGRSRRRASRAGRRAAGGGGGLPSTMRVTLRRRANSRTASEIAPAGQPDHLRPERLGEPQVRLEAVPVLVAERRARRSPRPPRRSRARAAPRPCAAPRGPAAPSPAPGPTQTRMRSVVAQGASTPCSSRQASTSASTRSAVRRSASSRSASRFPRWKKCSRGALRLVGEVHLPLAQPLEQLLRGDVHELDLVRALEDGVGHRLAHLHAGDLRDDVVQALDVLHVEGGVDVDPRVEQLEHVLPALGVARAGRVGVGELVEEQDPRAPRQRGVEVELLEDPAAVGDAAARQHLEAEQQPGGVVAAVGLDWRRPPRRRPRRRGRARPAACGRSCRRPGRSRRRP